MEHNAAYRKARGRDDRRYPITCTHCGADALAARRTAKYCSQECYRSARFPRSTDVEVWAPPLISVPGPRWVQDRSPCHPPIFGSMFVYGPCSWCGSPFMALAGDFERRSLYCSKRCSRQSERHRSGRFVVTPSRRLKIYERDGWTCQLCTEPVDPSLHHSDQWAATLDHIVPRSQGGDDSDENLRLAHRWCNSVRGDESYYTAVDLLAA